MKIVTLSADIKVFGIQVKLFPIGVAEAFDKLVKMIPGGFTRSYYGVFYMDKKGMVYYATAEEMNPGEAEKYSCERLTIEKGDYLAEKVNNWRTQTDCIKDVFEELLKDSRTEKSKPGVEWYKNDDEMLCMLKAIQPV